MPVQKALALKGFQDAFEHMKKRLEALAAVLETQAARDPLLEKCWQRSMDLLNNRDLKKIRKTTS